MAHDVNHYTINKGKLLFQPDDAAELGYEDLGNCSKLEVAEEIESLEHFSSRSGLKNRDQLVVTSLKATGSFTLDEITVRNLQKFFMGGASSVDQQSALATQTKVFLAADKIKQDRWFKIGARKLTVTQVDDNGGTPVVYEEGTDYELDLDKGLIFIIPDGGIADDSEVKVSYDQAAHDMTSFKAGEVTTVKGHLYFVADPAIGEIYDILGYGSMTPEGAYNAISEEYVTIDLKLEFLTHADYTPGLFDVERHGNTTD